MKKDLYVKFIIGIGIWFTLIAIFGVWEKTTLEAEMDINRKILGARADYGANIAVLQTFWGYMLQMTTWSVIGLALGMLWSKTLFPKRIFIERVVFSMIFTIFIMPVSIFVPYFASAFTTVMYTVLGLDLPSWTGFHDTGPGSIIVKIATLFFNGEEQEYEIANITIAFVVALALMVFLRLKRAREPQAS